MPARKTATKTSNKVKLNIGTTKTTKKQQRKARNTLKKLGAGVILTAILVFAIGGAIGFFGCKYLTRNDCFTINGEEELTLVVGETYVDEGAKVVAFNKDDSSKVRVSTNLTKTNMGYTSDEVGTYYIEYTVDNLKYGSIFKIKKIRLITFVELSEDTAE